MEMPQFSEEGLGQFFSFFFFSLQKEGKNIPTYCKISSTEDMIGLLGTRASRLCGAPQSWRRDGGREDAAAEGGASFLSGVFKASPRCEVARIITLQLRIKTSLGREP